MRNVNLFFAALIRENCRSIDALKAGQISLFFVLREGDWDVLEHNLLIKGIFRSRASITIISLAFETRFAPKFHRSNGSRSRSSRITNKLINSFKLSSILAFSSEEVCFVEFLSFSVFISNFEKSSSAVQAANISRVFIVVGER